MHHRLICFQCLQCDVTWVPIVDLLFSVASVRHRFIFSGVCRHGQDGQDWVLSGALRGGTRHYQHGLGDVAVLGTPTQHLPVCGGCDAQSTLAMEVCNGISRTGFIDVLISDAWLWHRVSAHNFGYIGIFWQHRNVQTKCVYMFSALLGLGSKPECAYECHMCNMAACRCVCDTCRTWITIVAQNF